MRDTNISQLVPDEGGPTPPFKLATREIVVLLAGALAILLFLLVALSAKESPVPVPRVVPAPSYWVVTETQWITESNVCIIAKILAYEGKGRERRVMLLTTGHPDWDKLSTLVLGDRFGLAASDEYHSVVSRNTCYAWRYLPALAPNDKKDPGSQ